MNFYHGNNISADALRNKDLFKRNPFGLVFILMCIFFVMLIYFLSTSLSLQKIPKSESASLYAAETAADDSTDPNFNYQFKTNGVLQEAGSMDKSSSPYFWLNSGGILTIANGIGATNQGALTTLNLWRMLYGTNNSLDTDGGKYPQNVFRLITKNSWNNVEESLRFKLIKLNMTDTPNRDGYSGVLLMSRYIDAANLYYAGVRMDGTSVIKKKYKGVYYTLASGSVFISADTSYNKDTNPNLIPGNIWMGLKTETITQANGSVKITLWIDKQDNNTWEQLLTAVDTRGINGSDVIKGPAHTGIRTDYLDVLFDDYQVNEK